MATVIENIQLYDELQQYTEKLTDEVHARTFDLQTERDKTQAILETAGEGIFYMDPIGGILYCNEAVTSITGYSRKETYGEGISLWVAKGDLDNEAYQVISIENGQRWNGEFRLKRKDTSVIDVQITITPLNNDTNQMIGFVGVIYDVSKIREAERMKTNFVANVSHELRTPLTNITLYLDLLRRAKEEKREQYFSILDSETKRLTQLVQDLLDLSKLDSAEGFGQVTVTNALMIMAKVVQLNEKQAHNKKLKITVPAIEMSSNVMAHPQQLEQVFTNIVANAINYTPTGGCISIDWGISPDHAAYPFWLSVTDNGYGIAPEELPFIFSRFYRGNIDSNQEIPGTGLGLAISKKIIDRFKGVIEVQSQLQKGTTFTVRLPVA